MENTLILELLNHEDTEDEDKELLKKVIDKVQSHDEE